MGRHYIVKSPPSGYIAVTDLVQRWDVAETTVRRWLKDHRGALPSKRYNGKRRCVALVAVEAFEKLHGIPLTKAAS